uniref:ABC transporter domain-containing protein n=1 Tax=Steinernema glaseri TaxID=37863 RepID=A0A1I7Y328_9BILA
MSSDEEIITKAKTETKKLTKKELKKQKKQDAFKNELKAMGGKMEQLDLAVDNADEHHEGRGIGGDNELGAQFSVSQQAMTEAQIAAQENVNDIKVENFDINANGRQLFSKATLVISAGHRYGFVGPNGMGKTTLLRHIAQRSYLQSWKKTLLIVSHDQGFLDNVCTDMILLEEKKLHYYKGNYSNFKKMHDQQMKEHLKKYEEQQKFIKAQKKAGKSGKEAEKEAKNRLANKEKKGGKKKIDADDQPAPELLQKIKEYQVKFVFPETTPLPGNLMSMHDVSFGYNGQILFKNLLYGKLTPQQGECRVHRQIKVGWFDQHSNEALNGEQSPIEYLVAKFSIDPQTARKNLGMVGLPGQSHTVKIKDLSGGQKSRVALAELSLGKPDMLILDEPTNNLDIESIHALAEAIEDYDGGVLMVTHDERLIRATECQLWIVKDQNVVKMDGDFDTYRDEILEDLEKQAAAVDA